MFPFVSQLCTRSFCHAVVLHYNFYPIHLFVLLQFFTICYTHFYFLVLCSSSSNLHPLSLCPCLLLHIGSWCLPALRTDFLPWSSAGLSFPSYCLFWIICLLIKYSTPPIFLIGWHHVTLTFHLPHSSLYKPLKMELIGCPAMSIRNYHYSLHNNLEGHSCTVLICFALEA
jgi:hypothetical protein